MGLNEDIEFSINMLIFSNFSSKNHDKLYASILFEKEKQWSRKKMKYYETFSSSFSFFSKDNIGTMEWKKHEEHHVCMNEFMQKGEIKWNGIHTSAHIGEKKIV